MNRINFWDGYNLKWYQKLWLNLFYRRAIIHFQKWQCKYKEYLSAMCEHGHNYDDCPDCRH